MGEEGEYVVFVGSLTVPLHNLWADAAIAYQKEHYPKMKLVADRYGVAESVDDSYRTASDAILAHPNLKGILTFGSQGSIGAGRALKEKGKADKIVLGIRKKGRSCSALVRRHHYMRDGALVS